MTPLALWLAACAAPTFERPEEGQASTARLPDRPMTLSVTEVAVGDTVGFRVVDSFPNRIVTILGGLPGQQTCPPLLQGGCIALGRLKVAAKGKADPNGQLLLEAPTPANTPTGITVGFQAIATDPVTGNAHLSNVVTRDVQEEAVPPPGGNVLIVLIDDVGVDRIGLYGASDAPPTPTLDALAAEGMTFDNAWAMPWCSPTRATLQTGRMPRRTGFGDVPSMIFGGAELDPNLTTIAEVMDLSPWFTYSSSYVGKWHLTAVDSASGLAGPLVQGWDWWAGSVANIQLWGGGVEAIEPLSYFNWQKVDETGALVGVTRYATTETVDDALSRVAVMPEPWLLQVSFAAAHSPYDVPPAELHSNPFLTDSSPVEERNFAMIEAMDTELGRLLDGLDPFVADRTTIVFLADNGTASTAMDPDQRATGRGKGTLFDAGVRVPFVVSGPLVGVPGSRSDALVSVADLLPTLADVAGVDTGVLRGSLDPQVPAVLDGVSLLSTLADPSVPTDREFLYAEIFGPGGDQTFLQDERAIRNVSYKLVVDELCGGEAFFEYVDGAEDEGPDLLALGGELTPEQQAGLDHLRTELEVIAAAMTYDSATWPHADPTEPVCP